MVSRHNKRRNIGLVYEILIREVSAAAVANDPMRAAKATAIISDHFGPNSLLGEELSVHQGVVEQRGCGPRAARRIVDELRAAGIRLAGRREKREEAKTAMIHEINRILGRDCFDRHRIPEYTAHASIGLLISRGLGKRLDEGLGLVRIEEALVSWLSSIAPVAVFDRDATALAYGNAVKIFEEELGRELTAGQRDLLRERIRADLGGNEAPLQRLYDRQRDELRRFLERSRSDKVFRDDTEMSKLLSETITELVKPSGTADEEALERLMMVHELKREIET